MKVDPEFMVDNPLIFWIKANQTNLPLLSKLARMIHCIPASTASMEREFSGGDGELIMSEWRSSINPQNFNNLLFLRSVSYSMKDIEFFFLIGFSFFVCDKYIVM